MKRALVVVLGMVAACGMDDGGEAGDGGAAWSSGSRIKTLTAKTTVATADGATYTTTAFGGWYDSERDEPCSPRLADDGLTPCLPEVTGQFTGFADAGCTLPEVWVAGCNVAAPKYLAQPDDDAGSCTTAARGPHLYAVRGTTSVYYTKSSGGCVGPTDVPAGYAAFAAGVLVAARSFAVMTTTVTPDLSEVAPVQAGHAVEVGVER